MRVLLLAALVLSAGGWHHRFYVIDGAEYLQIGSTYFTHLFRGGFCSRVEVKTYKTLGLKVHLCYV